MVTNQVLNEQKEANCIAITPERKYFHLKDVFVKRSLRCSELQENLRTGETYIPRLGRERLLNEASALDFIASNTTIPVPKLHACFEDDGAVYLIMEYVEGRGMDELEDEEKLVVEEELESYLQQIHEIHSGAIGGPSGIVVPPYRLQQKTHIDIWIAKPTDTDEYVFCHNDLSQQNVIVCRDSLKIRAVIDWEYAGYWPERFERRFYKRLGPSVALENEEDDAEDILNFLQDISASEHL
jgi:serine/threonine protein kinase